MQKRTLILATGLLSASAMVLGACAGSGGNQSGSGGSGDSLRVVFQETSAIWQQRALMEMTIPKFAEIQPDVDVVLEPIAAQESDYFTRLQLMHGSPSTAPDVIYQDTFQVRSDAAAGYIQPLDECVAGWDEWDEFEEAASLAGQGDDGKLYGISMGTDTRGIYFNKDVFEAAGLPTDWQPDNWEDMLDAARAIRDSGQDVIPLSLPITKSQGEAASMQGFQMLLYGTDEGLYNEETQQWLVDSQGFEDSLTFLETAVSESLLPPLEMMLDTNLGQQSEQLMRTGGVGMWMSGSWETGNWQSGENAWPEWVDHVGLAKMPTELGQEPGYTSMSGGWLLSIGANADPVAACDFITTALDFEGSLFYASEASQIAVRKDVASDPAYLDFNPSFKFFSSIVPGTHFRPATPDYPGISDQIQIASESVVTGQATPAQATATYSSAVERLVGADGVFPAR